MENLKTVLTEVNNVVEKTNVMDVHCSPLPNNKELNIQEIFFSGESPSINGVPITIINKAGKSSSPSEGKEILEEYFPNHEHVESKTNCKVSYFYNTDSNSDNEREDGNVTLGYNKEGYVIILSSPN